MSLANRLFETALNDLNSVTILYNSKHYNLALFQLQQAVEKFVKSYGLRTKVIKPEDLMKKISHLPYKVFTKKYSMEAEKISKRLETTSILADMVPPHQRGKDNKRKKIDRLKKLESKIYECSQSEISKHVTSEEIEQFIEGLCELEKEHVFNEKELFDNFKKDIIKTYEHFLEYFKNFEDKFILDDVKETLANPDNEVRNRIINHKHKYRQEEKFRYISFVWINLSIITAPHEQSSRYPSTETNETPIKYYDLNNSLVKFIPDFVKILKKSVDKYKEIFVE